MDFVYTLSNLIRTPYDLLNVLFHLSIVLISFLLSLYIGNRETFNTYIYNPYLKHTCTTISTFFWIAWSYVLILKDLVSIISRWTPISNRMLYISNLCKKNFDKWFK